MFVVQQNWFRELAHELHVVVIVSQVPLFVCKQSRKTVKDSQVLISCIYMATTNYTDEGNYSVLE